MELTKYSDDEIVEQRARRPWVAGTTFAEMLKICEMDRLEAAEKINFQKSLVVPNTVVRGVFVMATLGRLHGGAWGTQCLELVEKTFREFATQKPEVRSEMERGAFQAIVSTIATLNRVWWQGDEDVVWRMGDAQTYTGRTYSAEEVQASGRALAEEWARHASTESIADVFARHLQHSLVPVDHWVERVPVDVFWRIWDNPLSAQDERVGGWLLSHPDFKAGDIVKHIEPTRLERIDELLARYQGNIPVDVAILVLKQACGTSSWYRYQSEELGSEWVNRVEGTSERTGDVAWLLANLGPEARTRWMGTLLRATRRDGEQQASVRTV